MSQPGDTVRAIPLVEEELAVEKRAVETARVTVATRVTERREWVEETLRREEVSVERVPVGRVVDAPPPVREEDGVLIVPVVEEELVIEKRLVLKEELRIRKDVRREQVREPVTLRAEEAVVTRESLRPDE
jgi:stress response protein YsnF